VYFKVNFYSREMSHYKIGFSLVIACLFIQCSSVKRLQIAEIEQEVTVRRDQWGINHIEAKNEHDLFFAQGFLAAKDRLFQFELWRRKATGTSAELVGPAALKSDIGARLLRYQKDMDTELNHYHPRGKSIIESYVAGVNAYIEQTEQNPELLPFEFNLLGIKPGRWTPEIVVSRHNGIRSNASQELAIGRALAQAKPEKIKELMWFHPGDPDLTLDESIDPQWLSNNLLELYEAVSEDIPFGDLLGKEEMPEGSNNWVISGEKTLSGAPILANDPHRRIALPSLRYIVHLKAPGWNVIGGGEPVIPGVSIGHNEYGAWGLTIFQTDAEDIYVYDLNPENQHQYKYQGNWEDMTSQQELIKVRGEKDTLITLNYTRHGPVLFMDPQKNKAAALRSAWLEPGAAPYLASLRINQATDWNSFQEACEYSFIPGENMIWADTSGTIGWQAVGISPVRPNFSGMVPVPGDGRYEWNGYWPIIVKPHLTNPPKGFWATANQHVTPETYSHPDALAYTWSDNYRGDRVNEVLARETRATIEGSIELQTDVTSIPARILTPLLLSVQVGDSQAQKGIEWMRNWDYRLEANSVEAAMYVTWERILVKKARALWVPESLQPLIQPQLTKIIEWITHPELVFSENAQTNRDLFLVDTWTEAVEQLTQKFGPEMDRWVYGQSDFKHVTLKHPLSEWVDERTRKMIDMGPLPRGGYPYVPAANGALDNQTSGASFRMVTDLSDWDLTKMTNTPGQSGDPNSPYYKNLFQSWATDQYFPAYYSNKEIKEHTIDHLILTPKK
jgi:penicillin amidase